MKIQYLGHSCFLLTESTGTTIVTDPYGDIGYDMPKVFADVVTVSHAHHDHNNIKAVRGNDKIKVIDKEGIYDVDGVTITGIKSFHDRHEGSRRGSNIIFKFRMDGLDICHLGDIGEDCSAELLEELLPINILLLPVGGNFTIGGERAKEYVDRLMPEIVIPMHYKTKSSNLDIDKVNTFTDLFDEDIVEITESDELELSRDDLDQESTKIVVMKRKKI